MARARARSSTCCRARSRPRPARSSSRGTRSVACRRIASSIAASAGLSRSRVRSAGSPSSNVDSRATMVVRAHRSRGDEAPNARSPWSSFRPTPCLVDGLGSAGLRQLYLANALPRAQSLLSYESLAGWPSPDGPRPTCCARSATARSQRWVDHIIGLLMRWSIAHVLITARISRGLPARSPASQVRGLFGTDAHATKAPRRAAA